MARSCSRAKLITLSRYQPNTAIGFDASACRGPSSNVGSIASGVEKLQRRELANGRLRLPRFWFYIDYILILHVETNAILFIFSTFSDSIISTLGNSSGLFAGGIMHNQSTTFGHQQLDASLFLVLYSIFSYLRLEIYIALSNHKIIVLKRCLSIARNFAHFYMTLCKMCTLHAAIRH